MTELQTSLTFDQSRQFVLGRLEGYLDYQGVISSFEKVVNSPEYRKGMSRIWDVTKADIYDLTPEDMEKSSNYPTLFPNGVSDAKVAIVSERPDNTTSAKLFAFFANESNPNVRCFESLQEAIDWVSE